MGSDAQSQTQTQTDRQTHTHKRENQRVKEVCLEVWHDELLPAPPHVEEPMQVQRE